MSAAPSVLPFPTTPPDYHRIVSSTLQIPHDPQTSIPVGLLACQRDPLLRELISTVVSCRASQSPPPGNKRAKKDLKNPTPAEPLVEVILHDTVLFPEGGGQPSDVGIFTSADGRLWNVVEVKRHGGHAVHYVRVGEGGIDAALQAFTVGSLVGIALGEAGLSRRLDHHNSLAENVQMCMHTSQHLLSAVLDTRDLPTLSWSLTPYPTPSYVEIPRAMSIEEIISVQEQANRLVFEGRKVYVEVEELDAETTQQYRGPSVGIPADYTGGVKRTVVIDGVDRSQSVHAISSSSVDAN
ncbi:hypothetical protein PHLCEN_2v9363 [Hermanssonia centrifuga]|uniref:Uncharacterized protein n=1 Tax=Hermanssonia centrifuga TaxID=98765 RepID=A0A2R6NR25_9APHY|nr:hypothetical protein PHLCEN_2v9363 [Hermanssonia centrifuga]